MILLANELSRAGKKDSFVQTILFHKTTFFFSIMLFFEITSFKMPKWKHQKLLHFFVFFC